MRHERRTKMCIFIGRMYDVPDRSFPSRGCCRLLRESHFPGKAGTSRHTMQSARIDRVRIRTVTSYCVLIETPGEEDKSNVLFSEWESNCVWKSWGKIRCQKAYDK